jgi:acyl dehydratase
VTRQHYFEDFQVGDRFKSPSRTLTDAHFMFFAGMTGDNHPIHYDEEYGKKTRYGGRLAHGLLLASLTAVGASTLAPLIEESIVAFVEQTTRFRGRRSWATRSIRARSDRARSASARPGSSRFGSR